jgi:tellurium resistance protein TerD
MAVSLTKGGNVSLTKEDPSLVNIDVGLGWKPRGNVGPEFDLDACCFLLNDESKVLDDGGFVFFNNKVSSDKSTYSSGDDTTGDGDGDDEVLTVHLDKVTAAVTRIAIAVVIYDAVNRKQNFGQVGDAYIRIMNKDTGVELAKFDLDEDASMETAMIFGELYRHDGGWKFKAVGTGHVSSMIELAATYGVNAA